MTEYKGGGIIGEKRSSFFRLENYRSEMREAVKEEDFFYAILI